MYSEICQQNGLKPRQKQQINEIKKGIQKIKQTKLQILKQLSLDNTSYPFFKNDSLSYSIESTFQAKPIFKLQNDTEEYLKQINLLQKQIQQAHLNQYSSKQRYLSVLKEAEKYKQAYKNAQIKMKQYQKGQQKALAKAQLALSDAIATQKKNMLLRDQNNQLIKQRQRFSLYLKKVLSKQITSLKSTNQKSHIFPIKILTQLTSLSQHTQHLFHSITSHHCITKSDISPFDKTSSNNLFIISTYQYQTNINNSINNLISFFQNIQQQPIITNQPGKFQQNFIDKQTTISLTDNTKQIKHQTKTHIDNNQQQLRLLKKRNTALQKKISVLQLQLKNTSQQLQQSHIKIQTLSTQLQNTQQQNKKYKQLSKQQLTKKQFHKQISNKYLYHNQSRDIQLLQDRILQLEKQHLIKNQQINLLIHNQHQMKNNIQKINSELSISNILQQTLKSQHEQQLNSLKTTIASLQLLATKYQQQKHNLTKTIKKLEIQKKQSIANQQKTQILLQKQTSKFQVDIKDLQLLLSTLRQQIQQLKKQNTSTNQNLPTIQPLPKQPTKDLPKPPQFLDQQFDKKYTQSSINTLNFQTQTKSQQTSISQPQLIPTSSTLTSNYQKSFLIQSPRQLYDPSDQPLINSYPQMRRNPHQSNYRQSNPNQFLFYQNNSMNLSSPISISLQLPNIKYLPPSTSNRSHQSIHYQQFITPFTNYQITPHFNTIIR